LIVDNDRVQKAKESLGDRTPFLIAEILELREFDEHSLKSLCPVHHEDTPSFIYNAKMHNFHCFGCGCNIDILDAYMMTGDTYLSAVEKLFNETGISYSFGERFVRTERNYVYPRETERRERTKVDAYFATRKISKETLDHFDVREDEHGNAVFNYYDLNDVLTMVKYRPSHKIDKSKGEIKTWCQKGADTKPLLFNMNRVNAGQPLLCCEGEADSMAAYEAGFTNAVSVPFGSQNHHWIEENWEWLDQFQEIIICSDNDKAGVQMAKDVCPRLGTWRTKVVDIPYQDEENGHRIKDLNELLYYKGKQAVMDAIINAKDSPIDSVVDLSDVEDVNIGDLDGVYFGVKDLDMELFKLFYGTLTLVTGRPGCVSCDTEFFNGEGWKRIDQYAPGDKVLQYNEDGTTTLVDPIQYHKYPCEEFWKIETHNRAISQVVSDEHNLVYVTSKGNIAKKNALDLVEMHGMSSGGFRGRFITTFDYCGPGIPLSDAQIRVMCAVICDGTFNKIINLDKVRLNLKKERKKERLRLLLRDAGIDWEEHHWNKQDPAYTNFTFLSPLRTKTFDSYWYRCSSSQLRVIADEILFWDGHIDSKGRKSFSTTSKETADFVQFVFSSVGKRSSISIDDRVGKTHASSRYEYKNVCYTVHICKGSRLCGLYSASRGKLKIPRVKSEDGYKYCFTVPSGMLVLRHNNSINCTGNSGKTSFLYQIVCNVLEQSRGAWIFSRELPDFMSKSWMNYLLAGPRNIEERTSQAGSTYYQVTKDAKKEISQCYRGECYVYKNDWPNDVESIQESMEASARKYGSKLFLLDNLMTINLHSSDDNKYDKQTELINWLIQFASKYNVAVILVAHPRKFQNTGGAVDLYDIGGSSNLVNLAHRTISLRRVSKDEQEQGKTKFAKYSCVASVTKDRLRGRAGFELGMFYDEGCRRFFTNYEEFDRRYRWDQKRYDSPIPCPALDAEQEVYGRPLAAAGQ